MRFGLGRYNLIHEGQFLKGKNTQQMQTQIQRIIRRQSIAEYHHLFIDIFRVGNYNNKVQNGKFLIRKESSSKRDLYLRKVLNQWRFGLSWKQIISIRIPFFRRTELPEHRADLLFYLLQNENNEFYPMSNRLK